ncbi:MAG: phage antirepressor N-terminal domain-containing protein [Chloroflexi bacterium]|nr:phage antirepressor N-terminal domain-containing protein [Chloroflexota bacterium]MCI0579464.1 phage antirepressor N-terminal domain-containing protein [Chloroflexota bacterium]MCI0644917.1 phage antirepressor N-terminal domain-containing protein [Chloroflexota bacterium]MCI0729685.1 phage antirepressor N-terminal domain-containing protein [Chloroflexota bacterium]
MSITLTPSGGRQEMVCLALNDVPDWLFAVFITCIKPERLRGTGDTGEGGAYNPHPCRENRSKCE